MTEDDYKTQQMNNAVAANKVLKAYVGEPPKMEQVVFKMTPPSDLDAIADCGEDGCGECEVCKYLHFLDHAEACGGNAEGNTIQRNQKIEKHLDEKYPWWRTGKAEGG